MNTPLRIPPPPTMVRCVFVLSAKRGQPAIAGCGACRNRRAGSQAKSACLRELGCLPGRKRRNTIGVESRGVDLHKYLYRLYQKAHPTQPRPYNDRHMRISLIDKTFEPLDMRSYRIVSSPVRIVCLPPYAIFCRSLALPLSLLLFDHHCFCMTTAF